jgi:hypothetical protein
MFEMLIGCKKTVALRCGKNEIVGVISNYYEPFRLLKINNMLLPLELIEQIEVLDDELPDDSRAAVRQSRHMRLVRITR